MKGSRFSSSTLPFTVVGLPLSDELETGKSNIYNEKIVAKRRRLCLKMAMQ